MCRLGTVRDPVYTGPNEFYLRKPFTHRANSVTVLQCLHESAQTVQKPLQPGSGVYKSPRKSETVTVSRRHHLFPRQMRFEKRRQKFHADKVLLPRSG